MDPKNNSQAQNKTSEVKPNLRNVSRDVLQVEIRDPDKLLFSGEANAVSSKNSMGPFDILPQHENFISLLTDNITVYLDKHQKREIENTNAIVKAKLNKVNIFLGISSLISKKKIATPNNPQPKQVEE